MEFDVIVIGGGPSGMQAALEAEKQGAKVLLLERENCLGGILNQCIHNGFGLKHFNEELTGPEYAHKLAQKVIHSSVQVQTSTFVYKATQNKVWCISKNSRQTLSAKAIVVACGSREKTAGQIKLAGARPAGIYTAGMVQKMVSYYNKLPGKKVVILGSGDIGLIMARRLTFEGVKVIKVLEIMPTSSGLKRNIVQCLNDFNIPLEFSHTITRVVGQNHVEGVFVCKVDEKLQPIRESEEFIECDAVILSVGLIPEIDLFNGQIEMSPRNKSAVVDENRQTSIDGVFVSGNVLHIHDLADNATEEGEIAGRGAGLYALGKLDKHKKVDITFSQDISYTIPQKVSLGASGKFKIYFRSSKRIEKSFLNIESDGKIIGKKYLAVSNTGEMQDIDLDLSTISAPLHLTISPATINQ